MHKHSHMALLLLIFVMIFCPNMADVSWVDRQHFEKYPYCGQMPSEKLTVASTLENLPGKKTARGRITNSKPFTESYRWVVRVRISNLNTDGTFSEDDCSGTVITER